MNHFAELGILPELTAQLAEKHITRPTAVQCLAIPPLLAGSSVIFRSATGTGKTFAYLLPAVQRIIMARSDDTSARQTPHLALVVCAPTIELCSQIKTELDFLFAGCALERIPPVSLLTGSLNITRQIESLKKNKPLAVVGNPGRLLLLAKMGKLSLHTMRFLVLDEADRLTAPECREETAAFAQICARYRDNVTTAACSATVTEKIREYLFPLLEGAALLETDEQEILRDHIEHWAFFTESRRKAQTLAAFLAAAQPKKALVFTGRCHDAAKLSSVLQRRRSGRAEGGIAALYSGMDKVERKRAIDRFRSGKDTVLVSSDLAARGIDIPGISHVIALDVPADKDAYIHRAGRTGRAGKRGIMVSMGDALEMRRLAALEKKLGITVYPKELFQGSIGTPSPEE